MANIMDYSTSIDYDLQPFFKAGDCAPLEWIHRKKGTMYSTSLIMTDMAVVEDQSCSGSGSGDGCTYAVLSSNASGVAGTTFYQVGAQIMGIEKGEIKCFNVVTGDSGSGSSC